MKENQIEAKREITKIHFLVHPGFLDRMLTENSGTFTEKIDALLKSYLSKSKTLGENELMVIFLPAQRKYFKEEIKDEVYKYVNLVQDIKKVLGNRLIVFSSDGETVPENSDLIWKKIEDTAGARGFFFSKKLTAEAYGELIDACVGAVASNMHKAAGMSENKPVKILGRLTDFSVDIPTRGYEPEDPRTKRDFRKI